MLPRALSIAVAWGLTACAGAEPRADTPPSSETPPPPRRLDQSEVTRTLQQFDLVCAQASSDDWSFFERTLEHGLDWAARAQICLPEARSSRSALGAGSGASRTCEAIRADYASTCAAHPSCGTPSCAALQADFSALCSAASSSQRTELLDRAFDTELLVLERGAGRSGALRRAARAGEQCLASSSDPALAKISQELQGLADQDPSNARSSSIPVDKTCCELGDIQCSVRRYLASLGCPHNCSCKEGDLECEMRCASYGPP